MFAGAASFKQQIADERPSQELEAPRTEVPLIIGRPRRPDDRADDLLVGRLGLVDDAGGPLLVLLGHLPLFGLLALRLRDGAAVTRARAEDLPHLSRTVARAVR